MKEAYSFISSLKGLETKRVINQEFEIHFQRNECTCHENEVGVPTLSSTCFFSYELKLLPEALAKLIEFLNAKLRLILSNDNAPEELTTLNEKTCLSNLEVLNFIKKTVSPAKKVETEKE